MEKAWNLIFAIACILIAMWVIGTLLAPLGLPAR